MLVAWLTTPLTKTSFPHGHRDLIPSQLCPSPSCSSTADEAATSRKDVVTWWENGDGVRLEYLPLIIAGISLDRLTVCSASESTLQGPVQWKLLLIWSLLSIPGEKGLQRSCSHRSDRFSVCCHCCPVSLVVCWCIVAVSHWLQWLSPSADWYHCIQLLPF